jgi:hypothetical protein
MKAELQIDRELVGIVDMSVEVQDTIKIVDDNLSNDDEYAFMEMYADMSDAILDELASNEQIDHQEHMVEFLIAEANLSGKDVDHVINLVDVS